MSNVPLVYYHLTMMFSGIMYFALFQFAYLYSKVRTDQTLMILMFSCASFVYIISDAFVLTFMYIIPDGGMVSIFSIIREVSPLLFLIIGQFSLETIHSLKKPHEKNGRLMLWSTVAVFVVFAIMTAVKPSLLIISGGKAGYSSLNMPMSINDMGPLLIARDILLFVYAVFYILKLISHGFARPSPHPLKFTTAGMLVVIYLLARYWHAILFTTDADRSGYPFPYLGLCMVLYLVFAGFGRIKILSDSDTLLDAAKKDLERILYNDRELNIPSRMAFRNDLQRALADHGSGSGGLFLIFFDIDDFQDLNECYGETVGNSILRMLVERVNGLFSSSGTLYRVGGDEFGFLLNRSHAMEEAESLAGKIVSCLRNPFSVEGATYLITASVGVLQLPRDGGDAETALNNAYSVTRLAKKTKNTYEVFTQDLQDTSNRKIHIVNILRNSIEKDLFTMYYQPIVDQNGAMVHAESLLRYTGSDPSVGGPGVFLPILQEAGLMREIDNMVIRKAFHDLERGIKNRFNVAINLSTSQLVDPNYSGFLAAFAAQQGIDRDHIILEVTENRLMENLSIGRENLGNLKKSGFKIAIDDFGTGFSSLSYLTELPVDILKMDIVFTRSVPGNRRKESMVRHIMEMAHSLDLQVVAEGFETHEQFEFFRVLGCDFFQGYYFARPMPLHELLEKYPSRD